MIFASDDADYVARQSQEAQVWIDPVVRQCRYNNIEITKAEPVDQLVGKSGVNGEADIRMLAHDARDRHWQMSAQPGGARADARVTPFPIRNSNNLAPTR